MNTLQQTNNWLDRHRAVAFDLLRIYLGIGLFVRGVLFIADSSAYAELISGSTTPTFESAALMHYVALAHLGGGALMAIGLLTRLAALIQIPILAGAVFFVHLPEGLTSADQSLEFSALVLFLLVLVFFYGSGPWSVDHYLLHQQEPEAVPGPRRTSGPRRQRRTAALNPATRKQARPRPAEAPAREGTSALTSGTCTCGHDRNHPDVSMEARYGLWGMLHFAAGITGQPKEIVFRCTSCGEVVERSRDPKLLSAYRYRHLASTEPSPRENQGAE